MTKNTASYFYRDKPLFGLDIGFSSVKVMQISGGSKRPVVVGYGVNGFDSAAVQEGVLTDIEKLAKATYELFNKQVVGEITSRRVAVGIPAARAYSRTMKLPKLDKKDLIEAVRLEAEHYIPIPIDELYMDYSVISSTAKETELLAVAVPKRIIDSYTHLTKVLGLEAAAFETTISAGARLFVQAEQSDVPTILVDFGATSTDVTIYDTTLVVTGTVPGGGDVFTDLIGQALGVSGAEANVIKTKYGLNMSKKQVNIKEALEPALEPLVKEVKRMIRYYEERSGTHRRIGQIVTMGGGANLPGLSEYLTNLLRLPARMCNPWQNLNFHGLQPPNLSEKSMYATVAGLALINPREIFTS